jgi:Protein of unknown function (DUF2950)
LKVEGIVMSQVTCRIRVTGQLIFLALMIPLSACNNQIAKSSTPSATTFLSPDHAGNALLQAAKSGDQNALLAIFGPTSRELVFSGDAVQDKKTVDAFVAEYEAMHRWRKMPDGAQIMLVGADNFAFPIPLKKNDSGKWFFDTEAGKSEVLARRIGRNELAVIDVCGALADAQAEYFSLRHDDGSTKHYAVKFVSDPGTKNGLYWESPEGQPRSPLGPLVAFASTEGYSTSQANSHTPFHGYYFHMLNRQGSQAPGGAKDYLVDGKMVNGFAFIAYPAEYGNSGVMTFIINQDHVLLQKDLGKTTAATAAAITEFNPDSSWSQVEE